ncbi:aspartyl-phosphate phosphatase Spo0E family protein [Paenibacillus sp. PR3]|uniref:Aspartyl-phosphate phosphatase Spo0E family protein n=1 Tax=Paenibacillus terricola TaxID=2763503 RepID=A0ABR8N1P9_9BACL|nr:aspartyl-phosphate phosphatase Spo0E family protein [Paenibacillus terricola]MBD3922106.1 aspartyl-phosphate phosphatase Spo0E family protein [Paenibacillus terricola]
MNKNELLTQLQALRLKLNAMAEERGNLTDPEVLAVSEEADRIILVLQQMHMKGRSCAASPRNSV